MYDHGYVASAIYTSTDYRICLMSTGLRRTSLPWVASPTMVSSRVTTWWSRGAVLAPRRGWWHSASPCWSKPHVWRWSRSTSSSSIPRPSSGTGASRPPTRSRSSTASSRPGLPFVLLKQNILPDSVQFVFLSFVWDIQRTRAAFLQMIRIIKIFELCSIFYSAIGWCICAPCQRYCLLATLPDGFLCCFPLCLAGEVVRWQKLW